MCLWVTGFSLQRRRQRFHVISNNQHKVFPNHDLLRSLLFIMTCWKNFLSSLFISLTQVVIAQTVSHKVGSTRSSKTTTLPPRISTALQLYQKPPLSRHGSTSWSSPQIGFGRVIKNQAPAAIRRTSQTRPSDPHLRISCLPCPRPSLTHAASSFAHFLLRPSLGSAPLRPFIL